MSDSAAALAPAAEEDVSSPAEPSISIAVPEDASDDDRAMYEAYARLNGGEEAEEPDEGGAEPEPEGEEEAGIEWQEPEPEEMPLALPAMLKPHWANMTPEMREAVKASQGELAQRLSDQGRQIKALEPIKDVLTQAIEEFPSMSHMTPAQVANEVRSLVRLNERFGSDPLGATVGLIEQHGLWQQLAQVMQGQQPQRPQQPALSQADLDAIVDYKLTAREVTQSVTQFAQTAEHWSAVEAKMPAAIRAVQEFIGEGASPGDVLSRAYELAVSQLVPEALKAKKAEAAPEAAPAPDPAKAAAAQKAKSVNVKGSRSGQSRELTEDEALWAKMKEIQARG